MSGIVEDPEVGARALTRVCELDTPLLTRRWLHHALDISQLVSSDCKCFLAKDIQSICRRISLYVKQDVSEVLISRWVYNAASGVIVLRYQIIITRHL